MNNKQVSAILRFIIGILLIGTIGGCQDLNRNRDQKFIDTLYIGMPFEETKAVANKIDNGSLHFPMPAASGLSGELLNLACVENQDCFPGNLPDLLTYDIESYDVYVCEPHRDCLCEGGVRICDIVTHRSSVKEPVYGTMTVVGPGLQARIISIAFDPNTMQIIGWLSYGVSPVRQSVQTSDVE